MSDMRSSDGVTEQSYKQKLKKLRKNIRRYIFINAALCDQVSETQERLIISKEKRRFLADKLQQLRAQLETDNQLQTKSNQLLPVSSTIIGASLRHDFHLTDEESFKPAKKKSTNKLKKLSTPIKIKKEPSPCPTNSPVDVSPKPTFPFVIGGLTLYSIGDFHQKARYYTEVPIGFCSSRIYGNPNDPIRECKYVCKVVDGGEESRFEIYFDSEHRSPIIGRSANECHAQLIQKINSLYGSQVVTCRPQGKKFFGYSHPLVEHLLCTPPDTRTSSDYQITQTDTDANIEENDDSLNFDALQRSITFAKFRMKTEEEASLSEKLVVRAGGRSPLFSGRILDY